MKKNILKFTILSLFSLIYTIPALATPGTGGIGDEDEEPSDPVFIDNWQLLLILFGVSVGIYFLNKRKAISILK